jgi:hypothetical protein
MSIIANTDYNGLELGAQRRTNHQFNVGTTPLVIRVTANCCYRIISRVIEVFEGGLQYDVVVNPTSIETVGTTPVILYRNNTKVTQPVGVTLTSGWAITYTETDRTQVVDRTIIEPTKSNVPQAAPDYQLGGRIFTNDDVFFLVFKHRGNTNAEGFLNLILQERVTSVSA